MIGLQTRASLPPRVRKTHRRGTSELAAALHADVACTAAVVPQDPRHGVVEVSGASRFISAATEPSKRVSGSLQSAARRRCSNAVAVAGMPCASWARVLNLQR